jgi:hypothetical protein
VAALRVIQEELPQAELVEAGAALARARLVKTEREVGLLRRSADVVNIAHKTLMALTRQAGKSEFELWSGITQAMHAAVGGKLFVSGEGPSVPPPTEKKGLDNTRNLVYRIQAYQAATTQVSLCRHGSPNLGRMCPARVTGSPVTLTGRLASKPHRHSHRIA